jgi:hypothetical protein
MEYVLVLPDLPDRVFFDQAAFKTSPPDVAPIRLLRVCDHAYIQLPIQYPEIVNAAPLCCSMLK